MSGDWGQMKADVSAKWSNGGDRMLLRGERLWQRTGTGESL